MRKPVTGRNLPFINRSVGMFNGLLSKEKFP